MLTVCMPFVCSVMGLMTQCLAVSSFFSACCGYRPETEKDDALQLPVLKFQP